MVVPEYMNNVKWIDLFGLARDQGEHGKIYNTCLEYHLLVHSCIDSFFFYFIKEVCWAIVAAELIEALRKIHGHPDTNYSPQDLIDFADPKLRKKENKRGHYCYGFCVELALRHVLVHGIQKEVDRPFTGCSRSIPKRTQSECAHIAAVRICDDVERIFPALRHRPVKATIPMFLPEYKYIGDKVSSFSPIVSYTIYFRCTNFKKFSLQKIYHGPRKAGSQFVGLHSVTLVATGEEDGERYVLARSSHGPTFGCLGGYIKVSLDTRILHLPLPGETVDIMDRLFSKPRPLLWNFVYAKLPPGDERRKKKRKLV